MTWWDDHDETDGLPCSGGGCQRLSEADALSGWGLPCKDPHSR